MSSPITPAEPDEALEPHRDLAGLAVHDAADLLTGHVFGVLTEADTGLIRFLDVDIDGKVRHVLIPVGHARLEEMLGQKRIRLRAATLEDLENVPAYRGETPSRQLARDVLAAHGRFFRGDRYYAHPAYDHGGLYAGEHPIVRTAPDAQPSSTLERLSNSSEFRIAEGESDVRGWQVLDAAGQVIGEIVELIIDTAAEKVRYVVVRTADGAEKLLPIGYLDLDPARQHVLAPGLTVNDVNALSSLVWPLRREREGELLAQIERALDARNPFLRVDFSFRDVVAEQRPS